MLEIACVHADDELLLVQPAEQSAEYSELHELSTQDLQASDALPKSEVGTQVPLVVPPLLPPLLEPQAGIVERPSKAKTTMRGLFMMLSREFAADARRKFPRVSPRAQALAIASIGVASIGMRALHLFW